MPRGDGTGPLGLGPMTGRGLGYCAGFGRPGYMTPGPRFGWGRGGGVVDLLGVEVGGDIPGGLIPYTHLNQQPQLKRKQF